MALANTRPYLTIGALQAQPGVANGETAIVDGYAASGDGGGGSCCFEHPCSHSMQVTAATNALGMLFKQPLRQRDGVGLAAKGFFATALAHRKEAPVAYTG